MDVSAIKVEGNGSVVAVLAVNETDFHITTANADKDFKAEVSVGTSAPWELTSESPFQMGVGGSGGWGVKNTENEEETKSGAIILFKVDVEIAGVGEDKEDTEGAFVGYLTAMAIAPPLRALRQ